MTQDKMRRVITACVAAGTVLLTCLSVFIIYQWITLAVLNNQQKKLQNEVDHWDKKCEQAETDLEYYESDLYKNYAYWELQISGGNK
ncbi:MAG: hypothetical protein IJ308_07155 [Clostridia bacterium]|nr:hypothetical protein [Clostridia bacterium]